MKTGVSGGKGTHGTWRMGLVSSLWLMMASLLACSGAARAQSWAQCTSASDQELNLAIRTHHEQMFRMTDKVEHVWYRLGALPETFRSFDLEDLKRSVTRLADSSHAAVLFYAYSSQAERLCVWLIRGTTEIVREVRKVTRADWDSLRPRLLHSLGAVPPGSVRDRTVIRKISDDLLPPTIAEAMHAWLVRRLLVVPIFDLGEVPYAALELRDGRFLMDVARVSIVPGFFTFSEAPRRPRGRLNDSVVAVHEGTPALRFARRSAEAVRADLEVKEPLMHTGREVTVRLQRGPEPRFVFIAAHGTSNVEDPIDGGNVRMADGPWSGRMVGGLGPRALGSNPIVILSACESGTGKGFEVGSIGLSRAWYYVGASSVVSSLWRVDERATMDLMSLFVRNAKTMPVDEALWGAMMELRNRDAITADPVHWAAFSIFGVPQFFP